jgi:uncharacterized heparinase superfamily protein
MRYGRTLRRLSPVQIAHRLRLRLRAAVGAGATGRVADAASVPEVRVGVPVLADLTRPCPPDVARRRAEAAAEGRYDFLGESRVLGADPFPAPGDAALLWAYHLEYMDYLYDLGRAGLWNTVERLARARLAAGDRGGVAARHPYPRARRVSAWLETLALAKDSRVRSLLAVGAWRTAGRVAADLERDVGGNHLLENGLALVLAGAAFRGRRARRWLIEGFRILAAGAREQVLTDGGHYELSPMYHARVLGVLAEGGLAARAAGLRVPGPYWETVARMVSFLRGVTPPDGRILLLGDTARDEFLVPEMLARAVAARLPVPCPPVPRGDRAYPESGVYVMEDPGDGNFLALDAGAACPPRLPAHGQADTFALTLMAGGRELLVDPGLFEYAPGIMRDWCRATRAHSTVTVDGENSSEVWSSFRMGRGARVRSLRWSLTDGRGTISGEHDGYAPRGVTHGRLVSHLDRGLWLVADETRGSRSHTVVSRLHLHPETRVEPAEDGGWRLSRGPATLRVRSFGDGEDRWEDGWYCPRFGRRERSRLLGRGARGRRIRTGFLLSTREDVEETVGVHGNLVEVRSGDLRTSRSFP